jgi:FAD/FMN-containing dehydrogenase/Fe-S oxidoreductase
MQTNVLAAEPYAPSAQSRDSVSFDTHGRSYYSPQPSAGSLVNVPGLVAELRRTVEGEIRFDEGSRALYATDGSNYRQVPIGVVVPRHADAIVAAIAACRRYGAPVLARGGGTSLAGQCCNVAVVIDMTKYMHHVLELNPDRKYARVQPGTICDSLRHAANRYNLTFAPDPATHNRCTLGGMIGNNSCGIHSVMAGKTSENIDALDIVTYDGLRMHVGKTSDQELEAYIREGGRKGEIYAGLKSIRDRYADLIRQRYPKIPRRVSGYNLDKLLPENGFHVAQALVGSESTCVTVLEATTRLVDWPPERCLLVLGYPDVYTAGDHVEEVLQFKPIGLEGIDDRFIRDMKLKKLHPEDLELMPDGGGWLVAEFGGETRDEALSKAKAVIEALKKVEHPPVFKLFDDPAHERMVWEIRESGLGATAQVPGQKENWEGWEDSAVPPGKVGPYLRDLRKLLEKYHYNCCLYGHFGDGCIHTRIDFDLKTKQGIESYRSFISEAVDTVLRYGGSLSGEHGDGQSRAEFLPRMFGEELMEAFREFKSLWDPDWKMNPGKVVNAYRIDKNLRYGTQYNPPTPKTHFHFVQDHNSFARAMERCVGVGECRRVEHGTMCPSYMVTREEMHSTRGRARLLFEMLQGDPLHNGWRSEHVKEALDLCLSCKGCKSDCPVNVDMATYKAEFLSHHYDRRIRPRHAYASGLIFVWARLASHVPVLANAFTQLPGLRSAAKWAAGYAQQRKIPPFAYESFKSWFRARAPRNQDRPRVILWADTFNNYFQPEVAKAAVEVLEDAGFQVEVPAQDLCCGRPLYDYGMLDLAVRKLRQTLAGLKQQIQDGVPVVVLEPSCAAVFREEMSDLLHSDEDANRLRGQTFLLSEFLEKKAPAYQPPKLDRKAIVHGHCHHKAIMKLTDEEKVLSKVGLNYQVLDSGCCGMAGAFGYEAGDHYEVSIACGERVLLPAVREAPKTSLVVADGFSCREQILQQTDRQALHLAQVIQMAKREGSNGHAQAFPERNYPARAPISPARRAWLRKTALVAASVVLAGTALCMKWRARA